MVAVDTAGATGCVLNPNNEELAAKDGLSFGVVAAALLNPNSDALAAGLFSVTVAAGT